MNNKSTKKTISFHQTDRKRKIITGVLLSIILTITPFLFYLYKFAPADSNTWETIFGTISANGFPSVQSFLHAFFSKGIFAILIGIWFLTSQNWWRFAILIPFTMFLFQFIGVLNFELQYIDEFDFWYSLPIILPILFFLIYLSIRLTKKKEIYDNLKKDVDQEIQNMLSDDL